MGLAALGVRQYVRSRAGAPELQDLVARQVRSAACVIDSGAEPWCVCPSSWCTVCCMAMTQQPPSERAQAVWVATCLLVSSWLKTKWLRAAAAAAVAAAIGLAALSLRQ
jgi:hypothetical protein